MSDAKKQPVLWFETQNDWDKWLAKNHPESNGVWLKIAKKGKGVTSVNYAEALDVAICYGWIDGQKQKFDDQFFLQKFTPRRPRSLWSKINREKVENLIAAGKMKPAGMAEVDAAKSDGRWDAAYDSPGNMTVPEELQAALDANPTANAFFETLNKTNRYSFCFRVQTARNPEIRKTRIEKLIAMLENGEKFHS